ncbi:MAG: multidrug DMT transporter [Chloroflexi bacterium GWB2_49_20]|nr:MAG: multidrug DMT transporter [Chloroflexi bacterium GWB2_49_20]OGN78066.1 MAG: multidrug DMT transporter [Chloroflexi bacterium GWC2_49_37]OGN85104.1 MAG: multidrug DMT transporter [Chloroflexi bacterium GWD2_49_16]HBG74855.1 EamA family transporter [Anaerolineae bacterium]HCC78419.1 EamA family transporter [Anaerolineae bacterium]
MKHVSAGAILQALLAAVLFGASAPLSKLLLGEINPIPLAAFLYLGSGIGSWLLFAIQRTGSRGKHTEAHLSRADLPWLLGAILAGGVGAPILLLLGLEQTPASTASLLLNFEVVATALIAVLAFKEAVDKRILWAVGLITLASILLSWTGGEWGFSPGALGILGACLLWGLDNNFTRQISAKNPLVIVGVKGLGAGAFSLVLALTLGKPLPAPGFLGLAMLVGMVCYGLSIQLFILALRNLGAARTGALFGIAPFVGTILSLLILREIPQILFWAAVPFMLLGAWLMLTENHLHQHIHEDLEHAHAHSHPDEHHQHLHPAGESLPNDRHAHTHTHSEGHHAHPHAPDLHHRHAHARKDAA